MHRGDTLGNGDASWKTFQNWFFAIYRGWLPSRPVFPVEGNHDSRPTNGDGKAYLDLFSLPPNGASPGFPDHAERYYSFGMRMAAMALLIAVPARLFPALRRRPRAILTNAVATVLLMLVWTSTGHGQKAPSGMFVNANDERPLHDFVRTLPKNARIASHPMDGDGIPYFGARATMGTFETLQPWFVDSWHR